MDEPEQLPLFERQSPLRWISAGIGLIALYQLALGLWAESGLDVLIGVLLCIGVLQIGLPVLLLRANAAPVRRTLRLAPLPLGQCLWIVVLAACLVIPVEWLAQWNTRLIDVPEWARTLQEELRPDTAREWLLSALTVGLFAPIGEELIFRGLIQQSARTVLGGSMAAIVTGLLFALIHFSPWYALGLIALGLLMGMALERTGSLLAPMLLHAAYNLSTLALLGFDELDSLQFSPPQLGLAAAVCAGFAYVAFGRLRRSWLWDEELSDATPPPSDPD